MELKDQVTSLELSKQLKEAGVLQNSLFYWVNFEKYPGKPDWAIENVGIGELKKKNFDMVSAFTCSELGEMLPYAIQVPRKGSLWLELVKNGERPGIGRKWEAMYTGVEDQQGESECLPWPVCSAETEAEARGLLLLYLKKQGLI